MLLILFAVYRPVIRFMCIALLVSFLYDSIVSKLQNQTIWNYIFFLQQIQMDIFYKIFL